MKAMTVEITRVPITFIRVPRRSSRCSRKGFSESSNFFAAALLPSLMIFFRKYIEL